MKKWLLSLFFPSFAFGVSMTFNPSSQVSVSTSPASPTLIFASDSLANRTLIVNDTDFKLHIATYSTTFSTSLTTGTFYVPARSSYSPDGNVDPYRGPIYGVISGTTTAQGIGRQRVR